jgi:hypothetical protein
MSRKHVVATPTFLPQPLRAVVGTGQGGKSKDYPITYSNELIST